LIAAWLDEMSPLSVSVGESGRRLEPGSVTVAPSGLNLIVHDRRLRVTCERPPTTQFHVPGIDATFRSVADSVGSDAIGVTGPDPATAVPDFESHLLIAVMDCSGSRSAACLAEKSSRRPWW